MAELVDAADLKSAGAYPPCRFKSGPGHHVTIDFEDLSSGAQLGQSYSAPQGFTFEAVFSIFAYNTTGTTIFLGGTNIDLTPEPTLQSLLMTKTGGGAFSLRSLDVGFCVGFAGLGCGANPSTINAYDSDGALVAQRVVDWPATGLFRSVSFDNSWNDIHAVSFSWTANYDNAAVTYLDNIVIDVVPIPAAVWLFGSALLGLGWLRRAS